MKIQDNHSQALISKFYSGSSDNVIEQIIVSGKKCVAVPIEVENNISVEEVNTALSISFPNAIGYLKTLEKYYIILPESSILQGEKEDSKSDIRGLLTERELQVAQLVAAGLSNKEIARKLNISEWTISTHLRRIYAKLSVCNRASMVHKCFGQ